MKRKIIFSLLVFVLFSAVVSGAERKFTLVIDAGHGGLDCGARGSFSTEKTINLKVALAFGQYVERCCPDVNVIYTRKTDVFVPLHRRADIANKSKADVFVSVHTNALPNGHIARGIETYTMGMRRADEKLSAAKRENSVIMIEKDYKEHYEGYDPDMPESTIMFEFIHDKNMAKSVELAKYVQKRLCAETNRPNKGVKQDVFLVLRETSMPACLIELGFITTPDEERVLNDNAHIDKLARGIFKAFMDYRGDNYKALNILYKYEEPPKSEMPSVVSNSGNVEKQGVERKTERERSVNKTRDRAERNEDAAVNTPEHVATKNKNTDNIPVFKIQIMASGRVLRSDDNRFKGLDEVESYNEDGMVKYTYGSSTNYNEIYRLRKKILEKFPQAFIIAFKNGEKMNIGQAIKEFKSK